MSRRVLVVLALTVLSTVSFAATIHVPSQQPTIQAGINAAVNGDTVLVAPGTYTTTLTVDAKTVYILSSAGSDSTYFRSDQANSYAIGFLNGAGGLFSGFSWINQTSLGGDGFKISSSTVTIADNVFSNLSWFSNFIWTDGATPATLTVTRNTISNLSASNATMVITDQERLLFSNNTVDGLYRGLAVYVDSSRVENNIISHCAEYGFYKAEYSVIERFNCFWSNGVDIHGGLPIDPTDIQADPLFIDPPAGDYHLTSISPCINAGNPAPEFNDPDGSRNDIGAFPFVISGPDVWIGSTHYPTIRAAIDVANPNDTIMVGPGTAYEHLNITKPLTLLASFGSDSTTIDGQNLIQDTSNSVVTIINADSVRIEGFTVKGGRGMMNADSSNGRGGGIICFGTQLSLINCVISANKVGFEEMTYLRQIGGGGVYTDPLSVLRIVACTMQDNIALDGCTDYTTAPPPVGGGGIYANGRLSVTNSLFLNNQAQSNRAKVIGGAIWAITDSCNIINSTFTGNTVSISSTCNDRHLAPACGGAIGVLGSFSRVEDCRFSNNHAATRDGYLVPPLFGAAVYIIGERTLIRGSDFLDNSISQIGG